MSKPDFMSEDEFDDLVEMYKGNMEKIGESAIFLNLFSPEMSKQVLPCLQLGLAIMLDKPIVIVAPEGREIPNNLRCVAAAIYEGDMRDPKFQDWMGQNVKAIVEEFRG